MAATLRITAKEDVTKTLFKLEQQNLRLIEQNKRLARSSGRAYRESSKGAAKAAGGADRLVGSLARMAAGYFSVQAAIMAVTASLKDKEEQQRRSRDATITQSDAQRNMLRNLGNVSDEQQDQFLSKLQAMTERAAPKGGLATVYNMAATGLSASGANRQKTLGAIEEALAFAPDDPATATSITGALLHMSKATGRSSARENMGYLKLVGEQSAITNWEKIARNLSPAIIGVTSFGATPQEAGALVAAFTQGSADSMGKRTGTGAIKYAQQLEAFLPTEDVYGQISIPGRRGKTRGVITKGTGLKSLGERIEYLQSHSLDRERFLEQMTMEAKSLAPARQLTQGPKTMTGKAYSSSLVAFNIPFEKMAEQVETKVGQMNRMFGQQIAQGKRAGEVSGEMAVTQTPVGRKSSIQAAFSSEELETILADHKVGWALRKQYRIIYELRKQFQGAEGAFAYTTRSAANDLREGGRNDDNRRRAKDLEAEVTARIGRADAQREEATRLNELMNTQNAILERIAENTRQSGDDTHLIEKHTRGPGPAAVQKNAEQHDE